MIFDIIFDMINDIIYDIVIVVVVVEFPWYWVGLCARSFSCQAQLQSKLMLDCVQIVDWLE